MEIQWPARSQTYQRRKHKYHSCSSEKCTTSDLGINKLTVYSMKIHLNALLSRDPNYIVEESNLSSKLCTPKRPLRRCGCQRRLFKLSVFPEGWKRAKQLDRNRWDKFCKNRCKGWPVVVVGPVMKRIARSRATIFPRKKQRTIPASKELMTIKRLLQFLITQKHRCDENELQLCQRIDSYLQDLPEDAINISILLYLQTRLLTRTRIRKELWRSWRGRLLRNRLCLQHLEINMRPVKEIKSWINNSGLLPKRTGLQWSWLHAGKCEKCSEAGGYWGFCSPSYLSYPISLGFDSKENGLFKCQNVYDQTYPSNTKWASACLLWGWIVESLTETGKSTYTKLNLWKMALMLI